MDLDRTYKRRQADQVRRTARIYVDALAERLDDLQRLAEQARRIRGYSPDTYPPFKALYHEFLRQSDEFQGLSYLARDAIEALPRNTLEQIEEHEELTDNFRRLQVPLLREVIRTNFRLLRIWEDRLTQGVELPLDSREGFLECVRVIYEAKTQLQRPEYRAMMDKETMETADRAQRLLETLLEQAPTLLDLATSPERSASKPG